MSWLGIVVAVIAAYLAFKVLGAAFKLILWLVVLGGLYWFTAPYLGLPVLF